MFCSLFSLTVIFFTDSTTLQFETHCRYISLLRLLVKYYKTFFCKNKIKIAVKSGVLAGKKPMPFQIKIEMHLAIIFFLN